MGVDEGHGSTRRRERTSVREKVQGVKVNDPVVELKRVEGEHLNEERYREKILSKSLFRRKPPFLCVCFCKKFQFLCIWSLSWDRRNTHPT